MKHLVIAEKPSVARDIARVLGCCKKTDTHIEGNDYIVTWALGHLVTLADPEHYGEQYKTWNMDTLPMLPRKWNLVTIRQTAKQYHAIRSQLFRNDVSDIIIATDAGREGELVARWILEKAGNKKPLQRLWISSVTDRAIRDGFSRLRPGKDYDNLYHAAETRAKADWAVGINATRALTCKYNAQLSCGRVQTPTLAMIAAREEEIRSFVPKSFYGVRAVAAGISFLWTDRKSGSSRTFDRSRAEQASSCPSNTFKLTSVTKKTKKSFSPALYDLTALQQEASRIYGYSAKHTLDILQRLYEHHKVLTYPRTDSRYITEDMVSTLPERLRACAVGPFRKTAAKLAGQQIHSSRSFVDNTKVSDHHALIPTEEYVQPDHMSSDERKIYEMVVRRFLAVLLPPCEYEETTLEAVSFNGREEEMFRAKGNVIRNAGWKEISDEDFAEEENEGRPSASFPPNLKAGDELSLSSIAVTEGKTSPPPRFTEGTLIAAMENPVKYMEQRDKTLARTLDQTGGLGTVATRADIIEKLLGSFLMEKKGNELFLTSKGKQLLSLVPQDLKRPELTARWELRLQDIAQGNERPEHFMNEIEHYTRALIEQIRTAEGSFRHDNMTRKKCPQCGLFLLEVNGKHGKMLVCQDRACGYRETVARKTNARCPVCHKKMELVGKGENQKFVCSCGHKEKLSSFQERRKKEGKGVSKRDVNNYLKKQAKETSAPLNNAFAEALAKLQSEPLE